MHLDWSGLLLLHSQKCWRQKAHCRFLRILLFLPGLLQQTLQQTPAFLPALQRRPYTQTQGFLRPEFQPGQVPGSAFSSPVSFSFSSPYIVLIAKTEDAVSQSRRSIPLYQLVLVTCFHIGFLLSAWSICASGFQRAAAGRTTGAGGSGAAGTWTR